ncbi:MAG TPA: regulatory protein RecX [Casimicrobiaceae bacterium]
MTAGRPVSLKAQAVRLLARREYARSDLEQRLLAKGAPRADVAAVLDELVARGLLSNERYARALVAQKSGRYSRRSIGGELKRHGVDAEAIGAALSDAGVDDDTALIALWQRRFGVAPSNDREKARQVRFLQARGFDLSAILKMLRTRSS